MSADEFYHITSWDRTVDTTADTQTHDCEIKVNKYMEKEGVYEVLYVMIPNTFYTVNSWNNYVAWTENGTALNTTLTTGVYSASSLATHLGDVMTTESKTNGATRTYTTTYDSVSGLFTTVVGSDVFDFAFTSSTSNSARTLIGGDLAGSTADEAATQIHPQVVQLNEPKLVFFEISGADGTIQGKNFSATFAVPMTVSWGSSQTVEWEKGKGPRFRLPYAGFMNVRILDNRGHNLTLQGADWDMVVRRVG